MKEIQPLSPANLSALTRLILELWPDCSYLEEYENCARMLDSGKETAFLFRYDDGAYAGFITLSLRTDYVEGTSSSPVGYVEGIYVRPEYRRQGIAKSLLTSGETWCRQQGCKEMASDAEIHNQVSRHFHEKVGFEEVNRVVCYRKDLDAGC